jgi:hypothetical protein
MGIVCGTDQVFKELVRKKSSREAFR